jgi:hypothetical protein
MLLQLIHSHWLEVVSWVTDFSGMMALWSQPSAGGLGLWACALSPSLLFLWLWGGCYITQVDYGPRLPTRNFLILSGLFVSKFLVQYQTILGILHNQRHGGHRGKSQMFGFLWYFIRRILGHDMSIDLLTWRGTFLCLRGQLVSVCIYKWSVL